MVGAAFTVHRAAATAGAEEARCASYEQDMQPSSFHKVALFFLNSA